MVRSLPCEVDRKGKEGGGRGGKKREGGKE
jgi:hypothetical protein